MGLALCSDLSPANWIVASEVPWWQLVGFGPADFPAYARLRFLPDPAFEGQEEGEADLDAGLPDSLDRGAKLIVRDALSRGGRFPVRSYVLFRGPLSDAGDWDGTGFSQPYEPAFIWPADHAWCVANDVDPHWAGIGANTSLIERIVTEPRLDAVAADPADDQPTYR